MASLSSLYGSGHADKPELNTNFKYAGWQSLCTSYVLLFLTS